MFIFQCINDRTHPDFGHINYCQLSERLRCLFITLTKKNLFHEIGGGGLLTLICAIYMLTHQKVSTPTTKFTCSMEMKDISPNNILTWKNNYIVSGGVGIDNCDFNLILLISLFILFVRHWWSEFYFHESLPINPEAQASLSHINIYISIKTCLAD